MTVKKGDRLYPGAVIAEVPETRAITHKVMVPPDMEDLSSLWPKMGITPSRSLW